jgi:hypothetical protein
MARECLQQAAPGEDRPSSMIDHRVPNGVRHAVCLGVAGCTGPTCARIGRMSLSDEFWTAHDDQRERINRYVTLALNGSFGELLTSVRADCGDSGTSDLVVALVAAICSILEQAADSGGMSTEEYWQRHLLDIVEMTERRHEEDDGL